MALDITEGSLDVDLLARRDAEVGAGVELIAEVVRLRALLLALAARREVAEGAGAAADRSAPVLDVTGAEDRGAARVLALDDVERLDLPGGISPVVHRNASLGVHEPVGALLDVEVVAGAFGGALLRDDVDHAAGRFGAVQSGGGGALEDLDRFDLGGIEVVHAGNHAGSERLHRDAAARLVVDADAVDIDQRVAREREAGDAADADVGAGADHAAARRDDDARGATIDQPIDARDRGGGSYFVGLDLGDRVTDGTLGLSAGGTGDDDLVELDGAVGHRESNVRRTDRHGLRDGLVADHAGVEHHLGARDAGDPEVAVGIGHGALACLSLDDDLRAGERSLGGFTHYLAGDHSWFLRMESLRGK